MQREFRDQFRRNDDWTFAGGVSVPIRVGMTRHDVAAGVDVVSQDFLFRGATARQSSAGGPVPPLSPAAPVYGTVNAAAYGLGRRWSALPLGIAATGPHKLSRRLDRVLSARAPGPRTGVEPRPGGVEPQLESAPQRGA